VVYDGEAYWLWDGFHRLHARKRNGLYTVPAIVRQGTRRDAVLLSVGANATHGFRRTNADKRRSVLALLEDQEWHQWSDREIARRCAVDNSFVSKLRAELSVDGQQIETRRVVRNGTEYTMAPPQRTPAPAVASQEGKYATPDELDAAVRSWLVAYDTHNQKEAALVEVMELGENSITFDDLREWIDVQPRRAADLIQAAGRVLIWLRQAVVNERAAPRVAEPFVPADIDEQVDVEPPVLAQPSTYGWEASHVQTVNWRRARGTVTDDGRVLVQMSNGTHNAPWLELDDAGQHWMLSMIEQAQEVRS